MSADSTGFADYAEKGGVMKANPNCFFDECGTQSRECFTNPSCLKGITCLGNCRGEQLCATRCFARFGSERLNAWLSCTLEEHECVTTGVQPDTRAFYASSPPALSSFRPEDLSGKWFKVRGFSDKYDCYPCQINEFSKAQDGLDNRILFRIDKPGGKGFWQNDFVERLVDSRGPQGRASMTVTGKMFGLTFNEQWYVVGQSDGDKGIPPYRLVAYKGDTQQGPYEGAFVYTRTPDAIESSPQLERAIVADAARVGLDARNWCVIDNSCPAEGGTASGVSAEEASKDKLEWKDVLDLTEWFRPGTLSKPQNFNPDAM